MNRLEAAIKIQRWWKGILSSNDTTDCSTESTTLESTKLSTMDHTGWLHKIAYYILNVVRYLVEVAFKY
ncbi:hypothetical protein EB118_10870 [bacterium]|nr:hypothetical protein [bacterium]NDG30557.1 hypothetical protein [bacterium]